MKLIDAISYADIVIVDGYEIEEFVHMTPDRLELRIDDMTWSFHPQTQVRIDNDGCANVETLDHEKAKVEFLVKRPMTLEDCKP